MPSNEDSSRGVNSYVIGGFLGAVAGVVLGGLCGILLPNLYYKLTAPEVLNDGQWGLIFLKTVPLGLITGSIIGIAVGLWASAKVK